MGTLAVLRKTTHASQCLECGKCSTMCPLASFGGFSAARMMSLHDPERELAGHAFAIQRCLTCGSCEQRCPQGVRYTDYVRGLRQLLPRDARRSCPHGEVLQEVARMDSRANGRRRDLSWLGEELLVAEEGEIGLFVGCAPMFDVLFSSDLGVEMAEVARSAVRILNRLGIEPVLAPEERCCGHDLLWDGDRDSFERLALKNLEAFRERGVKHLLTACAECCRTWRLDYPEMSEGPMPKVEHLAEFLAARLDSGEIALQEGFEGALTYHDPCRLGRQLGVYDPPRELLQAIPGAELREMERSRGDSLCCGTPGFIHCDGVARCLQAQRLEGAAATGAGTLVTACPKCQIHFRCAQAEDRRMKREGPSIEVRDLTVLIEETLVAPQPMAVGAMAEQQPTGDKA